MLTQESIKVLRKEWKQRIRNTSGIIYSYAQKELIESFIKDIKKLNNKQLQDYS